jgi:hypothetical protein
MKGTVVTVAAIATLVSGAVSAQDAWEQRKIEFLISSVEKLRGARFVRNGSEHGAKEAAAHLRMKLKTAGDKVKTADDFIKLCASRSSVTGVAYLIRFSDGTTIKSAEYFQAILEECCPPAE